MVTYYVVLSGNILGSKGKKITGQMIINSGTVEVAHEIKTYEDIEMITEYLWGIADPTVKSFTNKRNVHISFIKKIK